MALRTDITIDWSLSPRIITVAAPSTSVTIQDLFDTLRYLEAQLPAALQFPYIVDGAGKQDLGGGINVGMTITLQNAQLKFADLAGPTTTQCFVTGGTIVRSGGLKVIASSTFTQVVVENQVGGVLATSATDTTAIENAVWNASDAAHAQTGTYGKRVRDNLVDFVATLKAALFDGVTFENLLIDLMAYGSGNIVKISDGVFEYRARDGTTKRFTLTATDTARTRS